MLLVFLLGIDKGVAVLELVLAGVGVGVYPLCIGIYLYSEEYTWSCTCFCTPTSTPCEGWESDTEGVVLLLPVLFSSSLGYMEQVLLESEEGGILPW